MNQVEHKWLLVDAAHRPLGRLASELAILLRGKHKPEFTSYMDTGDVVVLINADQVHLSGRKWAGKKYYSHSGVFGSLKTKTAQDMSRSELVRKAVLGMLPKNKMRKKLIKKLKIYKTAHHPHTAQKPVLFSRSGGVAATSSSDQKAKKEHLKAGGDFKQTISSAHSPVKSKGES